MDERRTAILAEFREFLESAISKAKVNFATAERLSGRLHGEIGAHGSPLQTISKSTLHDHVRGGRRQKLPSWEWVANLWAFLVAAAVENKVDPARLGTLEEWQAVYEAAEAKLRRLGRHTADTEPASLPASLVEPRMTWWGAYADVVPAWFGWFLNLEPLAGDIRCYEELYVPGLLQTEEYAEAVVRLRHGLAPEAEIRRRVELRMLRQRLMPHGGRRVWAIINEMALWNPLVDRAAMKRQLRHLLDASVRMPVQIVPAGAPACRSVSGPITVLRFSHEGLPDVVYLEQADSALYPGDPEARELYIKQFNSLAIAAYRPKESQDIIGRLIDEM
ncbi:DUF5753 domain-containing protein [Thermomonospora amylolytica]|uniref:DUF5753 domain-containing protein n=1 Tax=Thermomonospora amylolytica TaxID=1411117 RepID=UPI000E6CFF1F|nr:DUF5753 domain-containing protein [Thermomonospora amylolytica]